MTDLSERAAQLAREALCNTEDFDMPLANYLTIKGHVDAGMEHKGDCTNMPFTCERCFIEDKEKTVKEMAAIILPALQSLEADSANLARGVALEQAEQTIRSAIYGAMGLLGITYLSDEAVEAVELRIRSLASTDAAQALAHYAATVFHDTLDDLAHDGSELVVGGKEPVRIFSEEALAAHDDEIRSKAYKSWSFGCFICGAQAPQKERHHITLCDQHWKELKMKCECGCCKDKQGGCHCFAHPAEERCECVPCLKVQLAQSMSNITAHDAEIERRARLDEAKWWASKMPRTTLYEVCGGPERIAALAESQPAPAKEGEK